MNVAGAVALLGRSSEGKLAHGKNLAIYVDYRTVHHAIGIIKDSHIGSFLGKPLHILTSVAFHHTHKNH